MLVEFLCECIRWMSLLGCPWSKFVMNHALDQGEVSSWANIASMSCSSTCCPAPLATGWLSPWMSSQWPARKKALWKPVLFSPLWGRSLPHSTASAAGTCWLPSVKGIVLCAYWSWTHYHQPLQHTIVLSTNMESQIQSAHSASSLEKIEVRYMVSRREMQPSLPFTPLFHLKSQRKEWVHCALRWTSIFTSGNLCVMLTLTKYHLPLTPLPHAVLSQTFKCNYLGMTMHLHVFTVGIGTCSHVIVNLLFKDTCLAPPLTVNALIWKPCSYPCHFLEWKSNAFAKVDFRQVTNESQNNFHHLLSGNGNIFDVGTEAPLKGLGTWSAWGVHTLA